MKGLRFGLFNTQPGHKAALEEEGRRKDREEMGGGGGRRWKRNGADSRERCGGADMLLCDVFVLRCHLHHITTQSFHSDL